MNSEAKFENAVSPPPQNVEGATTPMPRLRRGIIPTALLASWDFAAGRSCAETCPGSPSTTNGATATPRGLRTWQWAAC